MNFSAYYACYNNTKATEFVLSNFRKHYPNEIVVLISDGGIDFSKIAKKYNTEYFYMNNIFASGPKNLYDSKRMIEWWNRQKLVCDISKSDYVIILEDDVYVKNKIQSKEDFALKGIHKNNQTFNNVFCSAIVKETGIDYYGMCGGSMYNVKIFREIYTDVIKDIMSNHDKKILSNPSQYYQLGAVDANMTYHYTKRGYSYMDAEWLTENPHDESKSIIHAWKQYYE